MKCRIIFFSGVLFFAAVAHVSAQSIDILIENYRQAVASDSGPAINEAAQALRQNSTAVTYIKANDPEMYGKLFSGNASSPSGVLSTGSNPATGALVSEPAPVVEASKPPAAKKSLSTDTEAAPQFKNYDRILKQAKQINAQKQKELKERAVVMTVSGLPEKQRREFLAVLKGWQFRHQIKWVMEQKFANGFGEYWFELKKPSAIKEFAYGIDDQVYEKFEFDLIKYSPEKIEYILKLH